MKIKYGIYCLIVFASCITQCQNGDNSVGSLNVSAVESFQKLPIHRVFIYVRRFNGEWNGTIEPDASGSYQMSLKPGLYDVFIASAGFAPSCKRLEITNGAVTHFDAMLQADAEHMEQSVRRSGVQ